MILFNTATNSFIRGCVISYGGPNDQSAYRSELIGLAAIITYVTSLVTKNNLQNVKIEVACDGISALQNVFDEWNTIIKTNMKHYDVIAYARSVKDQSSVKWTSRHVYGHQDEVSTELSIWERLNVIVDNLAAEFWDKNSFQYNKAIPLSDGFPTVSIKGTAVCSNLRKTIQQKANFSDWLHWWKQKQSEKGYQSDNLDWVNMRRAFSKLSDNMKRWVMKHSHGTCGVNYWLYQWNQHPSPLCERCQATNETAQHIWKCPKTKKWQSIEKKWSSWLRRVNCPERDISSFINTWSAWRTNDTTFAMNENTSPEMKEAITDQINIGWERFASGYISDKWKAVLASWTGNRFPPSVQSLLRLIWESGYKLWQERNDWVHNNMDIKEKHKISEINSLIRKEYETGNIDLPVEEQLLLRRPILEIITSSRSAKKQWLGRIYAARSRVRRRLGILNGEEVEDAYKYERTYLHNWIISGKGKIEKEKEKKEFSVIPRKRSRE